MKILEREREVRAWDDRWEGGTGGGGGHGGGGGGRYLRELHHLQNAQSKLPGKPGICYVRDGTTAAKAAEFLRNHF